MQEAQEEVEKRRAAMVSGNKSQWAIFLEVASLIFVAEVRRVGHLLGASVPSICDKD